MVPEWFRENMTVPDSKTVNMVRVLAGLCGLQPSGWGMVVHSTSVA